MRLSAFEAIAAERRTKGLDLDIAHCVTFVELPRPADTERTAKHLIPMCYPAWRSARREDYREHASRNANGLKNDP